MTSYLDYYKTRVSLGTTNRKDKLIKQAERTFERQLLESPSAKTLRATVPGQINVLETTNRIDCIVLDISKLYNKNRRVTSVTWRCYDESFIYQFTIFWACDSYNRFSARIS